MKLSFKSIISLIAAMLLAVGCGTAPEGGVYTTASVDQLEEGQGSQESEGQDGEGGILAEHKNTVIGGVVAVVCAAIPGCRTVVKNGLVKVKDGTGRVIAVVKKPFDSLLKKSDEAGDAAQQATKTADEAGGEGAAKQQAKQDS